MIEWSRSTDVKWIRVNAPDEKEQQFYERLGFASPGRLMEFDLRDPVTAAASTDFTARPGPTNSIVDVAGVRVGHCTHDEPGWLTGVTVVVAPPGGAVVGVDVVARGPGTRETDLLDPRNLVDRVDASVLGGGGAPGLGAVDGVVEGLFDDGRGWPMRERMKVVPIVPGAICSTWDVPARGATIRARRTGGRRHGPRCLLSRPQGCVGAGTGARVGGLKGGVGSASVVLESGVTVGAIVALNAVGSAVDPPPAGRMPLGSVSPASSLTSGLGLRTRSPRRALEASPCPTSWSECRPWRPRSGSSRPMRL